MRTVIIVGSSRKNGNTYKSIEDEIKLSNADVIDLNDYEISYYDYEYKNKKDQFLPLIKKLISNYDTFVFATPVYWYTMSGIMKVFFDRLSDLLDIEKETGRKLRGKNMKVISNTNEALDYDFYLPFRKSADYLGMNYIGEQHYIVKE